MRNIEPFTRSRAKGNNIRSIWLSMKHPSATTWRSKGGKQISFVLPAQLGLGGKDCFITESYLALFAKSRLRRSQEHMVFPGGVKPKHRECNFYSRQIALAFF